MVRSRGRLLQPEHADRAFQMATTVPVLLRLRRAPNAKRLGLTARRPRVSEETLIQLLRQRGHVDPAYRTDINALALLHRPKSHPTLRNTQLKRKQERIVRATRSFGRTLTLTSTTSKERGTTETP